MEDEIISIGDRVEIYIKAPMVGSAGWFEGVVVRIDPYSAHRSFFWVELLPEMHALVGYTGQISVLNPRNIRKLQSS